MDPRVEEQFDLCSRARQALYDRLATTTSYAHQMDIHADIARLNRICGNLEKDYVSSYSCNIS